jgi:4-hydroxy-tetrahydrodipicolinate reductase
MIKLVITGAAGRMGRMLISLLAQEPELALAGAVEVPDSKAVGQDAGSVAAVGALGVPIRPDYAALAAPDTVTLDFTNAQAALTHLEIAAARGAAIAIGSTGFDSEMMARVHALAPRTRTLIAPNMSLGVNVLSRLVSQVAAMLPEFDAEVIELHHRTKLDAPSGTALALGRAVAAARGQDFEHNRVHGRQGISGPRPEGQIGVMALRGGDAVGDHTVLFCGAGERLELIHRTQSREALARGALRAARWLATQPNGLYSMADVLGL